MMTPLKAIRAKCLECSAGSIKEVRLCPIEDCELFGYRFGKNPKQQGKGGSSTARMAELRQLKSIKQKKGRS